MTTNSHFEGPFLAVPVWASEDICTNGTPRDMQVLVSLVMLMERRTKEVRASVSQISEYSNSSPKTVHRSLKWLESRGIITIRRVGKPAVNVYRINYSKRSQWVTHDPLNGSPMTHLNTEFKQLNGSPMTHWNSPFIRSEQGIREVSIEILSISDSEIIKRAASGEEDNLILGADPDQPTEKPVDKKSPRRNHTRLVTQFVGDPRLVMSRTFSYRDVLILRKTLSRLQDSGLSEFTISQMIKRFLDVDDWRNSETSILLFSNLDIQKKLMEQVDTQVLTENPVLAFVLNDFHRGEIELPWSSKSQDQVIRKTVIMNGMDVCYRYPELIVHLIESTNGLITDEFKTTLSALNSLVRVLAGEEDGDLAELRASVDSLPLPQELSKLSKENLRPQAASITEAVYNFQRKSHGKR